MFLPFTAVFASLITSLGNPARCAIPQSQTDRATALIRQLDDDDKVVRDRASAGLAALKRQALPAIRHALDKQPSVAVKRRIRELLPRIRLDDFAARSPVFVWDLYGRYTHTFAVWDEYRAVTGDTPEARNCSDESSPLPIFGNGCCPPPRARTGRRILRDFSGGWGTSKYSCGSNGCERSTSTTG